MARDSTLRPIEAWEQPYLNALAAEVRFEREHAGLSRRLLAKHLGISATQIARIEYGTRRTRRSTLELIVDALAQRHDYDDDTAAELLEHLVDAAGPALAPESEYRERVTRRRERRVAKQRKDFERALQLAGPMAQNLARHRIDEWRSLYGRPIYRRSE